MITNSKTHAVTQNWMDGGTKYYYRIKNDVLEYKRGTESWTRMDPPPDDPQIKYVAADNNRVFILTTDNKLYWRCIKEDVASWVVFLFWIAEKVPDDCPGLGTIFRHDFQIEGTHYQDVASWATAYKTWARDSHQGLDNGSWNEIKRKNKIKIENTEEIKEPIDFSDIIDIAVGNWSHTVITYYVLLKSSHKIMWIDEEPIMNEWKEVPGWDQPSLDDESNICASHSVIAATRDNKIHWVRFDFHNPDDFKFWRMNWTEISYNKPWEDRSHHPDWHTIETPVPMIEEFFIDVGCGAPWPVPSPTPLGIAFNTPWYLAVIAASALIDRLEGRKSVVGFLGDNPIKPCSAYPFSCIVKQSNCECWEYALNSDGTMHHDWRLALRIPGTHYLRAPVKPTGLEPEEIEIIDTPPTGNLNEHGASPQALTLTFRRPHSDESDIQIAPAFEGWLAFIPAPYLSATDLPQTPAQCDYYAILRRNYRLEGTLILNQYSFSSGIAMSDVPLLGEPVNFASYESVRLTYEFLHRSLGRSPLVSMDDYAGIPSDVNGGINRLIFEFIHGRAQVLSKFDDYPMNDFAASENMPVVADRYPTASMLKLDFTMSTRSTAGIDPAWFNMRVHDNSGITDVSGNDIPGTALIPQWMSQATNSEFSPKHPNHSPVPPRMLFAKAKTDAWVDQHIDHPVRLKALEPLPGNKQYRRITVQRAPLPMASVTHDERRQFPMYRLIIRTPNAETICAQIPLNGHLYLPLSDGDHRFTAIPRWLAPETSNVGAGDMKLSQPSSAGKIIDMPKNAIDITIDAANTSVALYATTAKYDGQRIWDNLISSSVYGDLEGHRLTTANRLKLRATTISPGGDIDLPNPIEPLLDHDPAHSAIFGFIRQSAAAHNLAPEFLYAVIFGEAIGDKIRSASSTLNYDASALIPGTDLGLYWIGDGLPGNPVTGGATADIGLAHLLSQGYLDVEHFNLTMLQNVSQITAGMGTGHICADIPGWEVAVELVAAQLHARLDEMLAQYVAGPTNTLTGSPCSGDGTTLDHRRNLSPTEDMRRFMAYVRYSTERGDMVWEQMAHYLGCYIDTTGSARPWDMKDTTGALRYPTTSMASSFSPFERIHFNALKRLAVAEILELVGVFR
ncbi:MAG: hypothetical protein KAJ90_02040 [Desulfobacterales bacterium]|nr:hypothetical protein [Desulfobacterales bacterium]